MQFPRLSVLAAAGALAIFAYGAQPVRAALVTFSGLHNGINTATDPEDNTTPDPIPPGYQPLLNAYPAPGGNVDGANIGVTVTWAHADIAAQPFSGVFDHTAMVSSDNAEELMYGNGGTIDVQFSHPVYIPSLYYANYSAGTYSITISGYTTIGDATPANSSTFPYTESNGPNNGGYDWKQYTGLAGTPITELKISGDNYIQTDDYTINLAPEPATLGLIGLGTLGLCLRRRRA